MSYGGSLGKFAKREGREKDKYIDDGFGNVWNKICHNCGAELEVVRPGKVQCSEGCKQKPEPPQPPA